MESVGEAAVICLQVLGETPDEIASSLRLLGVKGRKEEDCACPIARYLSLCGFYMPSVGPENFTVLLAEDVNMPYAVGSFVLCFDRGAYEELALV